MKNSVTDELVNSFDGENYNIKKGLILSCLEVLRQFRNAAAHSLPLYLKSVNQKNDPSLKALRNYLGVAIITKAERSKGIGVRNLYAALVCLILLTRNYGSRTTLIQKLQAIEDQYLLSQNALLRDTYHTYLDVAKIPVNFIERLTVASEKLETHRFENAEFVFADEGEILVHLKLPKTPNSAIAQNALVYTSKSGKKYHLLKGCPSLKRSIHKTQITILRARERNLSPCSLCTSD